MIMCSRERGGEVIYCHSNYYEWQTDHQGNGWLLMGMRNWPSQSIVFEQTTIKHAWKINLHSVTCSVCFRPPQGRINCWTKSFSSLGSETVEFSLHTAPHSLANLFYSIYYIVLKVYWVYLLSIVLHLSFVDCLLSLVYVAACTSKVIFQMRR